ncbi:MAG: hypothetical protein IPG81_12360 [Sandaracinaceae bacterium]|nr:hypothetical protein [Sandaracinaceae bacterium]
MADITTKFTNHRGPRGGLLGVLVTLLGCATVPPSAVSRANQIAYFVAAHEGGEVMDVEACATGPVVLRPWSTPWERIEVLAGARVGDTLRGDAQGCVRYRATLVANRQVLAGPEALLSAQSEWLMRPVAQVTQAELHFALSPEQQVATAWPALPEGAEAPVTRVGQDPPGTHAARFLLPPLALALPSDVLLGRFGLSTRQVGSTELRVARVAGPLAHGEAELSDHLASAVAMVASVGGAFPAERVLAIVWPAPSDQPVQFGLTKRGGGASILLFFGDRAPAGSLTNDWVTVHELAHLLHPRVPAADRWLSEGIATYYQEVLRARAGWKTPEQAWARIAEGFAVGERSGTGRSLTDEASAMHETAAYTRVYWGGTAFVLAADMALRRRGSSLDEAVARCLREVEHSSSPVTARALVAAFDAELVLLADEYAARSSWPATGALLADLGVVYEDGEVRLVDAPDSALRDAIMRPPTDR